MVSKNNRKLIAEKNHKNEKQRFALRKLNIGVASVLVGLTFSVYGGIQSVHADTTNVIETADSNTQDTATTSNTTVADQSTITLGQDKAEVTSNTATTDEALTTTASTNQKATGTTKSDDSSNTSAKVSDIKAPQQAQTETTATDNNSSENQQSNTEAATPSVTNTDANITADGTNNSVNMDVSVPSAGTFGNIDPKQLGDSLAVDLTADTVTVDNAQDFNDAIAKGKATTINVAKDIDLGELSTVYPRVQIKNKRNITIQSADNTKHNVDFNGTVFDMGNSGNVEFNNLNLYSRNYYGLVANSTKLTFKDINFQGAQLARPSRKADIVFEGTNNVETVNKYSSPVSGKTCFVEGRANDRSRDNGKQVIQLNVTGSSITFAKDSNTTLSTVSGNVIQLGSGSTINVEDGAKATLNPHTGNMVENGASSVAQGLYANGGTINLGKGADLTVNTEKTGNDKYVSGGIYLRSGSNNINIADQGSLNVNVDGEPWSTRTNATYPVYIGGTSTIKTGKNSTINVAAKNLGNYQGNLIKFAGKGTVDLGNHANFIVSGDGTGAVTGVSLGTGSTFTVTQPEKFQINLEGNTNNGKALVKNGSITLHQVKQILADGHESSPMGTVKVNYDANGKAKVTNIIGGREKTEQDAVKNAVTDPNYYFIKSGEDVTVKLNSLKYKTNEDGTGTLIGKVEVGGAPAGGVLLNISAGGTKLDGTVDSPYLGDTEKYAATTNADGMFSVKIPTGIVGSLKDTDNIEVDAMKDFVTATGTTTYEAVKNNRSIDAPTITIGENGKLTGKTEPGATVEITLPNGEKFNGVTVDAGGNITGTLPKEDLTGGNITAVAIKDNVKSDSTTEVTPDKYTQTPTAELSSDYSKLTGTAEAGATVTATLPDGTTKTATADADGNYSIDIPSAELNGKDIKVSATDTKGNTSDLRTINTPDKVTPEAPTATLSGDKKSITGTAEPGSTVTVKDKEGTVIGTATADTDGKYSIPVSADQYKGQTLSVTAKDSSDNESDPATVTIPAPAEIDALRKAVGEQDQIHNDPSYYNGTERAKKDYDDAVKAGQDLLKNSTASQAEVDQAAKKIEDAKSALDGHQTKTETLQNDVNGKSATHDDPTYKNSSKDSQEAYDNAVKAGQEVLENPNASQAEVDKVAKKIEDAKNALDGNDVLTANKTKAKGDINDTAEKAKQAIDNAPNLTPDEKAAAKNDVDDHAKAANDAIEKVTMNDNVKSEIDKGNTNINKDVAKAAVQDATNAKNKQIDNAKDLTNDEKQALKDQVAGEKKTADDNIDAATTQDAIDPAKDTGVDKVNGIKVPTTSATKDKAKQALKDALDKKINGASNLSDSEKDSLKKQAQDEHDKAVTNINSAKTNDDVAAAAKKGVQAIEAIIVPAGGESSEPTKPAGPSDPTDPAEPAKPAEPSDPTDPTDPAEPVKPSDPTDPTDPAEPTKPTAPVKPADPTEPTEPAKPTDPAKPNKPAEPTDTLTANHGNSESTNAMDQNGETANIEGQNTRSTVTANASANLSSQIQVSVDKSTGEGRLPQTGNVQSRAMSVAGLVLAELISMFGLSKRDKKND